MFLSRLVVTKTKRVYAKAGVSCSPPDTTKILYLSQHSSVDFIEFNGIKSVSNTFSSNKVSAVKACACYTTVWRA